MAELPEDVQAQLPFLVVPKPSKKEKNAGLDGQKTTTVGDGRKKTNDTAFQRGATERSNPHPSVKPLTLMMYLLQLGSRAGMVVLDPYAGSGTTLVAAAMLDRRFIGIERDAEYVKVARARVAAVAAPKRPADPRSTASGPKDPRKSQPTAPGRLTAGELFAGVGGFRLGLGRSGWDTVFSNQWEPGTATQHASECYVHNFGDEGHHNEDITTLLDRGLDDTTVIPELTLLCGGFPCVDYSVAKPLSQSKGLQGEKGQLWWQVHRLLEHRRPPARAAGERGPAAQVPRAAAGTGLRGHRALTHGPGLRRGVARGERGGLRLRAAPASGLHRRHGHEGPSNVRRSSMRRP